MPSPDHRQKNSICTNSAPWVNNAISKSRNQGIPNDNEAAQKSVDNNNKAEMPPPKHLRARPSKKMHPKNSSQTSQKSDTNKRKITNDDPTYAQRSKVLTPHRVSWVSTSHPDPHFVVLPEPHRQFIKFVKRA